MVIREAERVKAIGAGDKDQLVKFRGKVFIFSPSEGVLYFRASGKAFAKLHFNGAISREGKVIGRRTELEFTGLEVVAAKKKESMFDLVDYVLGWGNAFDQVDRERDL